MANRTDGEVLNCGYGYHWPLNLHKSGFVRVVSAKDKTYIWAPVKETLYNKEAI